VETIPTKLIHPAMILNADKDNSNVLMAKNVSLNIGNVILTTTARTEVMKITAKTPLVIRIHSSDVITANVSQINGLVILKTIAKMVLTNLQVIVEKDFINIIKILIASKMNSDVQTLHNVCQYRGNAMEISIVLIKKMKKIAKVNENVKNGSLTVAMASVSFQPGNAMEMPIAPTD
jgi:hypothetical protein